MAPLDFNAPTAEEAAEIRRRKAAITRRIRKQVLAELGIDRLPKRGERTLVTGAQGTGKSRTCAETIARLPRRRSLDLVARAEPGEGRRAGRASTTACAPPTASWGASCAAVARSIRAPATPTPCVPGIRW